MQMSASGLDAMDRTRSAYIPKAPIDIRDNLEAIGVMYPECDRFRARINIGFMQVYPYVYGVRGGETPPATVTDSMIRGVYQIEEGMNSMLQCILSNTEEE